MTIKAVLRDGRIQPVDPLPPSWQDGKELRIEEPEAAESDAQIEQWAQDLEASASALPAEEHDRFRAALAEDERESKEAIRREWGMQ